MKKFIILTQYYPPETGAPQNRLSFLARYLQNQGFEVTVLTAMPNYPMMRIHEEYRGRFMCSERSEGITIHRSWIYVSSSKHIISRLLNYFSFTFTALISGLIKLRKSDYLLCESPPLFLGISAFILSRIFSAKFIFNVSDLWPESAEKLGIIQNKTLLGLSTRLEEGLYRRSAMVCGQTHGIADNIQQRFPDKKVHWFPNGIDLTEFDPAVADGNWRRDHGFADSDFLILYAGIIGYAQGLDLITETAKLLRNDKNIKFLLIGEGPVKPHLQEVVKSEQLKNVFFFPSMPKKKLISILYQIDATVVPLKKIELFKGAIPSKLFEGLACKNPVLLGVEGEAKEIFIDQGRCGLAFEPENAAELKKCILQLVENPDQCCQLGEQGYRYIHDHFSRQQIALRFTQELSGLS